MEPILSKQEISDLLSTLQQQSPFGGGSTGNSREPATYDEINLFQLTARRTAPETIPNFDLIMDLFGEYYGAALSALLQCRITITESRVTYQKFNTYLVSEPTPAALGVMSTDPLQFGGMIAFNTELAFTLLEFLLGGSPRPETPQPNRTATRLELSLLESLMINACDAFSQAILPIVQINADLVKTSHDRRLVSLVGPDTDVAVCTLTVESDHISDTMDMVFPVPSFTPYKELFENLLKMDTFDNRSWLEPVSASLRSTPCTVMAQTDVIDMTIRELIELKEGDILTLNHPPTARLDLLVEGKKKFSGLAMQRDRKRYVRITDANF